MPIHTPVATHYHGMGHVPNTVPLGSIGDDNTLSKSHRPEDDRQWIVLDEGREPAAVRAAKNMSAPLKQTEADLAEMRMRSVLDENQTLREVLRMGNNTAAAPAPAESLTSSWLEKLRQLGDLNQSQRDEIIRMRMEHEQTAAKLSKAEANVDRKLEMVQILRAQLDEADTKSSSTSNEERMKTQEQLMQAQAHVDQLKAELNNERLLKEDAWDRLLKADPDKMQQMQSKLEDERMNAKEMLQELRQLRSEKDSEAAHAANTLQALSEERNKLHHELNIAKANADAISGNEQELRSAVESLQHQRVDTLETLQNLREDYANLDALANQSKSDNQALLAQLRFLTQQLQAKQNEAQQPMSILKNMSPAVPLAPRSDDNDEQARFYEQQVTLSD